jgi:drug/metabolite transporter (DMT)-like permease
MPARRRLPTWPAVRVTLFLLRPHVWRDALTTDTNPPTTAPLSRTTPADSGPPTRSKITGGLAALACAACCAIPLLVAAGVVTGAGAVLLQQTLLAVAAAFGVAALGLWWIHRRRTTQKATTAGIGAAGVSATAGSGRADGNCSC